MRSDFASATTAAWAEYIVELRRAQSARHALLAIQHLDAARAAVGVEGFQSTSTGQQLRARINMDTEQTGVRYFRSSTDSYDVAKVANYVHEHLPALPTTAPQLDRLRRLRIRALVFLRLSTA